MDSASIIELLMGINGLEAIGIIIIYGIVYGVANKLWIRWKVKKQNPHIGCPYYSDFKLTVRSAVDRATRIFKIENYDTIKKQMAKCEMALLNIIDIHNINYVAMIREKNNGTVEGYESDIHHYSMTMQVVIMQMKLKIKDRIVQNHIAEKNDEAFNAYMSHANENLVSIVIALLDKEYDSRQFNITRIELHDYNLTKLEGEIYPILNDMWRNIRTISQEADILIKEIEEEE
jgi:hypothetical protein